VTVGACAAPRWKKGQRTSKAGREPNRDLPSGLNRFSTSHLRNGPISVTTSRCGKTAATWLSLGRAKAEKDVGPHQRRRRVAGLAGSCRLWAGKVATDCAAPGRGLRERNRCPVGGCTSGARSGWFARAGRPCLTIGQGRGRFRGPGRIPPWPVPWSRGL